MSGKKSSKKTELRLAGNKVASIINLNGPNPQTQFYDGTDLDSDHLEDGEPTGQSAPGSVSGECFFRPSEVEHQAIWDQIDDPETHGKADWSIVYPDGSTYTFTGTAESWNTKAAVGDGIKCDFAIKLSSFPVFTPAALGSG